MLIQSQRLLLRNARVCDAPDFLRLDLDPNVMRFLGGVSTGSSLARSRERMTELVESYSQAPGFGIWPCFTRTGLATSAATT